jgi:esterase/lipase superfamily enzyme
MVNLHDVEAKNIKGNKMKVLYRRLLLGFIYISSLVVVAVIAAYVGRNFTGIGPVPERSAFSSRLPSIPDGNPQHFQFYYATNRVNDSNAIKNRGNQLNKAMTFGTFEVRISPDLPIQPRVWFDTNYMEWLSHEELPHDKFLSQLKQAVDASPDKSLLIIVWGFRDWFQSAALKTAYSAYALDLNTPVLLFDWPGNQGEGVRGYTAAQRVATQSAPDLGLVLVDVMHKTGAKKVWLMGSSLGCQTICDSFNWLSTQPQLLHGKEIIDHVVLSAPDVAADIFDDKFAEKIQALSRHLTVYVSSNDQALLTSYWVNGRRPLGRKAQVLVPPDTRTGQFEFEEAIELLELQLKGANNISIVDATPINRTRNLHHFFTDSPEFFNDLFRRLLQPENNVSRPLYPVRTREGANYWILWD